ncbi:hypothetical protein GALMADRAFT_154013 [Galerina marginata CBS 339.88]|uniref:Transmembrane protein n=1 Tax=Galerina marginata (strain CBS 339.88) TaxID=685588 RepID=A0A067TB03_GALM3|nr:hypothetical protein GALMADRAFT_154013 [Galerina marginata CBS 339.88]
MDIAVILDDARPRDIVYSGTQWVSQANSNSFYNSTLTVCHTEIQNTTTPPSFTFYFYGSDINIYGPLTNGVALNYTIDSTSVRPGIINANGAGKSNINIWNLQGLDNTVYHTLEVLPSAGLFSIDYITYTPAKYTGLAGRNLIVDDADHSIQYSANWTKTTGDFAVGSSYKGTISGSSTKGSTMKFDFVGASISVYGLLNQQDGKLSASFSVDGGNAVTYAPFDGTQTANASSWSLSQQFFHQDLVPGNHSLLLNLNEVTGSQTLWIDSLVFEGTSNTPLNQTSASNSTTNSSSSPLSGGAIGGIIVGVVALALILFRGRSKVQSMMSKPRRSNSPANVQTPPAAPTAQTIPLFYQTSPSTAMHPGYANPGMTPPSMPYFQAPAPVPPPQAQEYRPPPVGYSNTPLQLPRPSQEYSSSQHSFTDTSVPVHSHVSHQYMPQPMPPQPSSHAAQTASQAEPPLKSQPITLTHNSTHAGVSSSSQPNNTEGRDGDPVDEPPPYTEGV